MGIQTSDGQQATLLNEINITPFVDVALVLLVIFMVTAPMIGRGVEVDLPRTRAAIMEVDQSKLLLVINERREVFLGDQRVPHERLEVVLRTNERLQREREVYLQADRRVPYGFVVHVMAILREAGIDQLGLVTDPLATEEYTPAAPENAAPAAAEGDGSEPAPGAEGGASASGSASSGEGEQGSSSPEGSAPAEPAPAAAATGETSAQ